MSYSLPLWVMRILCMLSYLCVFKESIQVWCMRIRVAECVFRGVFYCLDDGEPALCRQPVLILWPPPQLQHVGNKPFSCNLQTVQQSMGNYLSQSMGQPFYFSLSLPLLLSYLYRFSQHPLLLSLAHPLLIPSVSFFAVSLFFPPTPSLTPLPRFLLAFPPALSAPQHLL